MKNKKDVVKKPHIRPSLSHESSMEKDKKLFHSMMEKAVKATRGRHG